ncbi:hypothetical protein ER308_11885 [Egibacter rhizosphaerae]|uniref:Bifunctional metallophosphatase/5'-nucleotidase n=1 Tax=Egibacter rhizosphaerae TaxID=1670831 RepID=A0A411YG80_9ACTN|nr:cell wall-binding repeat-containing protein [Egibacter rhizosphaerae]QBI20196.1 hypothetical protein ER308_11885 [Egibacter rhizosphaerae]
MGSSDRVAPGATSWRRYAVALAAAAVALGLLLPAAAADEHDDDDNGDGGDQVEVNLAAINDYHGRLTPEGASFVPEDVFRLEGADRVATAVDVSQHVYDDAEAVVLARADEFADALAGAPLASAADAPILLTRTGEVPSETLDEIDRLGADAAYLLGGSAAISDDAADEVEQAEVDTTRLDGPTRFETAIAIAEAMGEELGVDAFSDAYVVEGLNPDEFRGWPDAMAISALAAYEQRPILLAEQDGVPEATAEGATALEVETATLVGGSAALGNEVDADFEDLGIALADRLEGDDRYATSVAVAEAAADAGMDETQPWLVTGLNWPDGVTSGAAAAEAGAIPVLVHGEDRGASEASADWISETFEARESLGVIGGQAAIADDVVAEDVGGAAYLGAHIDAFREAHEHTYMVDAGDLVGGTPVLSSYFNDVPTVEIMNEIGLDVQTVGNHEFDAGQEELLWRRDGGEYPGDPEDFPLDREHEGQDFVTLSTNVVHEDTGDALTQPYHVAEFGDASVGFLGVTTESTDEVVHPDGIDGLEFLGEAEAVADAVPDLQAEDPDAIVVLMHEGGRQAGGMNECIEPEGALVPIMDEMDEAVDLMVTGHTHQTYVCDEAFDDTLVTQANEYGNLFTEISLSIEPGEGVVDSSAENQLVHHHVEPDPEVQAQIDDWEDIGEDIFAEVVGQSEVEIPRTTRVEESAQGNLATDALTYVHDVDFAFQNSGGLRADMTHDDDMEDGRYNIRLEYILDVWPFGNETELVEITGAQLEEYLNHGVSEVGGGRFIQVSGLRIEYDIVDESGDFPQGEVHTVEYWDHRSEEDGTPVDLSADATYQVATNDFMVAGGDGYPVLTDDVYSLQNPLELDVERYVRENSPVAPEVEGRIVESPAE